MNLQLTGASTGLLYEKLEKNTISIYISLIGAMIFGRIVWGLVSMVLYGIMGNAFLCRFFKQSPFKGSPGIILQLVLIPVIIITLRKAKVIE